MLTKPFKPLALAFLVNLIISVEDKIRYESMKPAMTSITILFVTSMSLKDIKAITTFVA